jgi:hypothetical protein
MAINTSAASHPVDIRRARFSWQFHTPGRRRWLLVQFVSAPRDSVFKDEQAEPSYAPPCREVQSQAWLLDNYTGGIWRRRSF